MKILSILALLPCLTLTACKPGSDAAAERPPTPVRAVPVRMFTPQSGERYSASLTPARQLTLSFRVPGFIQFIYDGGQGRRLEAGDPISAGTVLAVLRAKDYEIQVEQAKAQLETARRNIDVARSTLTEAEASLTRAESAWKRADSLYQNRALTSPDWEAARAQRDIAAAQVTAARSQVEAATGQQNAAASALSTAELAKTDSVLTAPWSGRLLQRSVDFPSATDSADGPSRPAQVF